MNETLRILAENKNLFEGLVVLIAILAIVAAITIASCVENICKGRRTDD